jgi:uncharacterized protein YutE (UPF0331/DUF86 family)
MVDRLIVERILGDIKANVEELKQARDITWDVYRTDTRSRRFVERTLQILVEACIDLAQHIIADEQLREPSSYRDTFIVLAERGILASEELPCFEQMAAFRNLIVHYYDKIDDTVVFGVFKRNLGDFDLFVERITAFVNRPKESSTT